MSDLNRKNTAAVEQELKAQGETIRAQQVRMDGLLATMSSLQERLNMMEQAVCLMRAKMAGSGPGV